MKNETGITPGPWRVDMDRFNQFNRDEQGNIKPSAIIVGNIDERGDGDSIASLTTRFYNGGDARPRSLEGEWQANARAIAAVPDLLEALRAANAALGPSSTGGHHAKATRLGRLQSSLGKRAVR